ncbi:transcription initiation factor IIB [Haloglomus halophilum]|uniref:transcription initiation factor IIB n=1 Tax=Haloglomus halophilum TaxID=2962672 RepID=UPI0020C9C140|nr:transcription initiation factor IIB family protein [Haloglomus halophilum]
MSTTATTCPECDGRLRSEGTETVCGECGLVVSEDAMDRGPEWRSFADDDTDPRRTGAPLTRSRHDRGLSTEIGRSTRLKGRKRRRVARMRKHHKRASVGGKADRNQVYGFTEVRRLVSQLELPESVRDRACVLFESAQEAGLLQGRSIEGFAAAAVYATCRTASVSRTRREIVDTARADASELAAAYDALNRELGLPTGPIDPSEYLARFASKLDLPNAVERRARALAEAGADAGLVNGRNPSGFAGGCLYAAAREHGCDLTQREAAEVADVTPVTLRTAYRDVRELDANEGEGRNEVPEGGSAVPADD